MKKIAKGTPNVSPKKLQKQMEKHLAKVTATAESLSRTSGKEARRARKALEEVIADAVDALGSIYRDGSARVPALRRPTSTAPVTSEAGVAVDETHHESSAPTKSAPVKKAAPAAKSAPAKKAAPAAKSAPARTTAARTASRTRTQRS